MPNSYPFNIPALTDAADIQAALRNYHYGLNPPSIENSQYGTNSIAGYLQGVTAALETAQNRLSTVAQLVNVSTGAPIDLNDATDNGVYSSPTGVNLTTLNYPVNVAGIITHVKNSTDTARFQMYQTIGNELYIRSATKPSTAFIWTGWGRLSLSDHNHDERYYTETEIDSKVGSGLGTAAMANKVLVTNAAGQIVAVSDVTPTEVAYLSGVTSGIQSQLDGKAASSHSHNDLYYQKNETARIYLQATQPTSAAVNSLWIW